MDLVDRVSARARRGRGDESRYSIDTWISDYLIPSAGTFTYGNTSYPFGSGLPGSLAGNRAAEIANSLPGYRSALQACPPAFAAQMVRALVLSQARFTFRNPPWSRSTPRRTFGNGDLALLERPWGGSSTTGDLISRAEWHAGLAGNAYVYRQPGRLRLLRPDWTAIICGSQMEPDWPSGALDAELIGYIYANRGIGAGEPHFLLPKDMAHWAPLPDPEMTGLGMSWLTPAIREMQGDRLAAEHKIRYFEQGATPNLVVKGIPAVSREQFLELVEDMEERHAGVANAYRTLYLTAGADATVIGSNLAELDLGAVQGRNETRLSVLSRVPASVLGISEGLAGSSLNAGNFGMARRIMADTWVYPTLQNLAHSLAPVVTVPPDAELWFDVADMPILREDARDAADIEQVKAMTITAYVKEGFTPESSIAAVTGQDVTLLRHTGMVSVQLHPPGETPPVAGTAPALPAANGAAKAPRLGKAMATKKPYGDISCADPGYLDADGNQASKSGKPGVKRYPLSADKVMAAWSYINQAKNAGQYTPEQLKVIKGRIKAAMAKHGHKVSEAASADPRALARASDLKYGQGSALWKYWTHGKGYAKWSGAVHKWTTLRDLLLSEGVPPGEADGLATNIIMAVMPGYMKQAHAQEKHMTHFAPDLDVVRSGGGMDLKPAEDGSLGTLTGRFSEFGRWYRVQSKMEGDFLEQVAPGATADTIRDNKDSMRVLFDHGMDAQIGNKVLGPIASLTERSDGPHYEVPLFDTSYNRDLLPGLKAGVYGASMRMRVTGDTWDDKPARSDANPDGLPERTITAMKVLEFGPVTFPANPGASAGVRSGTDDFYHRLRQADAPAFEDAMRAAGLPLTEDFTGRDGARSAPGGEENDASQENGGTSPPTILKAALRDRVWRMRRQLDA